MLRVGVECSGSYGSGLTRHLAKNGFAMLEMTFPDKTVRRKRGKDDFIDAEMAAEAAFTGARTVTPKSRDGMVEALRMLQKTRSTAVAARRVALQMIRADIISAPKELRDQLRGMTRMQLIRHLVATRPDSTDFRTPLGAAKIALKRLAKRYVDLDDEVSELDDMIDAILADAAPLLVQLKCVGAQSAAQLMVTVGDNPERLRSEASFAMLCGVAPVPVSSGMTYRHRLNRGGDRQANSAIHIIATGRLRTDERTKEYVARKMAEGHTKMEAIRCLKRYIVREVYYVTKRQSELVNCSWHLEGHPRLPVRVAARGEDHARRGHQAVDGRDIVAVGQRGHRVANGVHKVRVRARPHLRQPQAGRAGDIRLHRGILQPREDPLGARLAESRRVRESQLEGPHAGSIGPVNENGADSTCPTATTPARCRRPSSGRWRGCPSSCAAR